MPTPLLLEMPQHSTHPARRGAYSHAGLLRRRQFDETKYGLFQLYLRAGREGRNARSNDTGISFNATTDRRTFHIGIVTHQHRRTLERHHAARFHATTATAESIATPMAAAARSSRIEHAEYGEHSAVSILEFGISH